MEKKECVKSICRMRDTELIFCDGWFLIVDAKGEASPVSPKHALAAEIGYYGYQASMDVNRGGMDPEQAYPNRGFEKNKVTGQWIYIGAVTEQYQQDAKIIENELVIPKKIGRYSVTSIVRGAFENCRELTKVVLPESVKSIGDNAFKNCSALHTVELRQDEISIGSGAFEGTLVKLGNDREFLIVGTVLVCAKKELIGCVTVPERIQSIASEAFKDCAQLQKIVLPKNLTEIGNGAFSGCKALKEIVMPETLGQLGSGAFRNCESLESIELPNGLAELKRGLFSNCKNLRAVKFPHTLKTVCADCFDGCGMDLDFKAGTDPAWYIGLWLIRWRPHPGTLTVRPGTVGIADADVFRPNKVGGVVFPDSLRFIGAYTFQGSPLTEIVLPAKLQEIGDAAFRGTNLRRVVIPSGVEKLPEWTFMNCERLEEIQLLGNTTIEFPAITGRRDKKKIVIIAESDSAEEYCRKYGEKYHLLLKHKHEMFGWKRRDRE